MNRKMPVECAVCMHRCRLLEGQLGRCRARKNEGGRNVLVTNGSAALWVLEELLPCIDAMNIDLKGFTEDDYRKLGGDLETVKDFIKRAAQGCHVELTTLIVPGENDSEAQMEQEARWISSISPEIPLHVTRFFPPISHGGSECHGGGDCVPAERDRR